MVKKAAETWLEKAKDDLAWTRANIREKIWSGACFTAQQAAEKSLKAYLLSKGKLVRKIHDLGSLLEICRKLDSGFEQLREACATLTDYYASTRYPDVSEFMEFSRRKAQEALNFAESIVNFAEMKISKQEKNTTY